MPFVTSASSAHVIAIDSEFSISEEEQQSFQRNHFPARGRLPCGTQDGSNVVTLNFTQAVSPTVRDGRPIFDLNVLSLQKVDRLRELEP